MGLIGAIARRWHESRRKCYVCRKPIAEGDDFCSDDCWLALQV